MYIAVKNCVVLVIVLLFVTANNCFSLLESDEIHLKNSSKIVGKIVKFDVDDEVTIRTDSGSELTCKMSDVDKIEFKSAHFKNKKTSSELGVTFGTPSLGNIVAGYHLNNLMFKASGLYLGDRRGIQLEFGYKFSEYARTYHAFSIVGGLQSFEFFENCMPLTERKYVEKNWKYVGIVYNMNSNGFYIQPGICIGEGDFSNPNYLIQIGYVYQFRK